VIKLRRVRWAGNVTCIEEINIYKIVVGKPEMKRPLGRPRRRFEDIKTDLTEIGLDGVDWIHLA
jgi:hypothetical protein